MATVSVELGPKDLAALTACVQLTALVVKRERAESGADPVADNIVSLAEDVLARLEKEYFGIKGEVLKTELERVITAMVSKD